MLSNTTQGGSWNPKTYPLIKSPALPQERDLPQPFINPDVFRPSLPIVEIPHEFPVELPTFPAPDDWAKLPKPPMEMPDWSDAPWHFPQPKEPEITIPKDPNFPGQTIPKDTWLLA